MRGVAAGDVLHIRAEPNPHARPVGQIPPQGTCIRNLGCRGGLTQQGLSAAPSWEYPAKEGICQGLFETLYRAPFVLRMDLPPNRIAELLSNWQDLTRHADLLVDWGCGRLTAGLAEMAADTWPLWHAAAAALEATVVLEKAPDGFRQEQDVFGPPRADWELTHKIKLALDPHGILAPGRLPGRR